MDLSRRGVGTQDDRVIAALTRLDKERILHIAGGMVRREIQQLEVDFIRLNLARGVDLKTHVCQDIQDAPQLLRGRVQPSHVDLAAGQRDIELFLLEGFRQHGRFDRLAAFG